MCRKEHDFLQVRFFTSERAISQQPCFRDSVSPCSSALMPKSPGGKHSCGEVLLSFSSMFCVGSSCSGDLGLHPGRERVVTLSQPLGFLPNTCQDTSCVISTVWQVFLHPPLPPVSFLQAPLSLFPSASLPWSSRNAARLLLCLCGHEWMVESGFCLSKLNSSHTSCQRVTATGET